MKKITPVLLVAALTAIPLTSDAFFGWMNPWNWGGWGGWGGSWWGGYYPYYGYGYPGWGYPYGGYGYGYPGWGYPYALPYAPVYTVPTTPASSAK